MTEMKVDSHKLEEDLVILIASVFCNWFFTCEVSARPTASRKMRQKCDDRISLRDVRIFSQGMPKRSQPTLIAKTVVLYSSQEPAM